MKRIIPFLLIFSSAVVASRHALAQGLAGTPVHGNFQFDGQYYLPDSLIGAPNPPDEKFLNNAFANFNYESTNFLAGLRYESYLNPLLGFDPLYKGSGISYRYLTYRNDKLEVTAGNFYEQFGSGLTFRSYEERSLGVDNAMDGIRVKIKPAEGVYLKGVVGRQRNFWSLGEGIVRGGDAELNFNEAFSSWNAKKTQLIIGGSFISKYQADQNPDYILPENVGCGGGRISLMNGGWTLSSEYSHKINDPSTFNNYIYKDGNALLVNLGYNQKGFSALVSAKHIDNMSYRSERDATGNSLNINYLPALSKTHTYLLPAIYPYATQPNGEVGFQAEVFYNLKQGSPLGGEYGTDINVNYSRAQDIYKTNLNDTMGYETSFFKAGDEVFFEDFNVEINRKWSKSVRTIITYVYLNYNKDVIEGRDGYGHVYSHSGILETIWKITPKKTLRTEIQHLYTEQDQKSWAVLLAEYTMAPKWSFSAFDQYNYGNENTKIHYFTGSVAFTSNANRFSLGYGRQRAGILCVGGVCRNVPASSGISFSITSSF